MKTQAFTVINNITVGITTVSFSKNRKLLSLLEEKGFNILINEAGKRFTENELIDFLNRCDVAIVGLDKINDDVLSKTGSLKAVVKYGVGLDNIDFDACEKHGVRVLHTQGVNKRSVAELALGSMLALCRNFYVSSNNHKQGLWQKDGGTQLTGKTVGIIGLGHIGQDVVSLLKPFNCRILVNDIVDKSEYCKANDLTECTKQQIFAEADIITIHTPLTELTADMVNTETFALMKPSAFILNTARGGIVNEQALKQALKEGKIAGASIDAYVTEPPEDIELVKLPNLICTPHIGGNSAEAVEAMGLAAIDNLIKFAEETDGGNH